MKRHLFLVFLLSLLSCSSSINDSIPLSSEVYSDSSINEISKTELSSEEVTSDELSISEEESFEI